tara:strand:+ start:238 stop:387 length:150 start_codon:yes stop_codon:yes gene_type:complete
MGGAGNRAAIQIAKETVKGCGIVSAALKWLLALFCADFFYDGILLWGTI